MPKPAAPALCYAQSGGVTAVINATAGGVIRAAQKNKKIARILGGQNGILGVLNESLIDVGNYSPSQIAKMHHTPGGVFGSCRIKLPDIKKERAVYERLMAVFRAHDIRWFLYNGGNDSADTAQKIAAAAKQFNYPLSVVAIPKTIDNDLAVTDCSPGFGSAAKYVAVSVAETTLDIAAMAKTSTKVFILEVMGRNAGWLAAAGGLAPGAPLIIFPEVAFNQKKFLAAVQQKVQKNDYAVVVASEGARDASGKFLSASSAVDNFSHHQLGGVAPILAALIQQKLNYKCHWSVADYLQRSARHIASATDIKQATAVGEAAVRLASGGETAIMPVIRRLSNTPYRWQIATAKLSQIANKEKKMPPSFISKDGYNITQKCRQYIAPLITGEDYPPYKNGLPDYLEADNRLVAKKLAAWRG